MANTYLNINAANVNGGGGGGSGFPNPADADLSMGAFNIVFAGGNSTWTVLPSEGGAGIQAAIEAASAAGGGIVQLFAGTYVIENSTGAPNEGLVWPSEASNVHLVGIGPDTILSSEVEAFEYTILIEHVSSALDEKACNNIAVDATTITTTTAAQAAPFLKGMPIIIRGTDADSIIRYQRAEVAVNGVGATGVIAISGIFKHALTSVAIWGFDAGINNAVKNLKIIHTAGASHAIGFKGQFGFIVDNVTMDGKDFSGSYAVEMSRVSGFGRISNCQIMNYNLIGSSANGSGMLIGASCDIQIENTDFINCGYLAGGEKACIEVRGANTNTKIVNCNFSYNSAEALKLHSGADVCDFLIAGCSFYDNRNYGIEAQEDTRHRGIRVIDCDFRNNGNSGIKMLAFDYLITGCSFTRNVEAGVEGLGTRGIISNSNFANNSSESMYITASQISITGNTTKGEPSGIYIGSGSNYTVSGNVCEGHSSFGIRFDNGSAIMISGNTSRGNTTAALKIGNAVTNLVSMANNYQGETLDLGSSVSVYSIGDLV